MVHNTLTVRLGITGSLFAISFLVSSWWGTSGDWQLAANIVMIMAAFIAVWPIAKKALASARYRIIGIDALVTLAVIGAVAIGEYWEAAAVAGLFLLGEYLEVRALRQTRSAIQALIDLAPLLSRVIRNGREVQISPSEVRIGEYVVVRQGEKISVDGVIEDGGGYVDESLVTGESMPVAKEGGDQVYAGTILNSGYAQIRTDKISHDTLYARIINLIEEAQESKAKTQRFLERFAQYYTPAILLLAAMVFILTQNVYISLTLLVIACPGALVIATPVAIVAGIGNGAKRGMLIKGGEAMEKAGQSQIVAIDKTGTLTVGAPSVVDSISLGVSKSELLLLAASVETYAEHPIGRAIVDAIPSTATLLKPSQTEVLTGRGIKAVIDGRKVVVGNVDLLSEEGVDVPFSLEQYAAHHQERGITAVFIARSGEAIGAVAVADAVRPKAKEMVAKLQAMGKKVVMLTGDSHATAQAVASQLGIHEYYAKLLPEDKVAKISQLQAQYGRVMMVGDGVNDAPALAVADTGLAVGGVGKDVAMETADIVLLSGKVENVYAALELSSKAMAVVRQNVYFAVGVVLLLVAGVIGGVVFLSSGMLLHVLSVLAVILNAIRLLRYNAENAEHKTAHPQQQNVPAAA